MRFVCTLKFSLNSLQFDANFAGTSDGAHTYIPDTVVTTNGIKVIKGETIGENGVHVGVIEGHS